MIVADDGSVRSDPNGDVSGHGAATATSPVPRQLPARLQDSTGRAHQLSAHVRDNLETCAARLEACRRLASADLTHAHRPVSRAHLSVASTTKCSSSSGTRSGSQTSGRTASHTIAAWIREKRGEDSRAMEHDLVALSVWQSLGDHTGTAITLNNVGWDLVRLCQYEKARTYSEAALGLAAGIRPSTEAHTLSSLAWIACRTGDDGAALDYGGRAVPLFRAPGESEDLAATGLPGPDVLAAGPEGGRTSSLERLARGISGRRSGPGRGAGATRT